MYKWVGAIAATWAAGKILDQAWRSLVPILVALVRRLRRWGHTFVAALLALATLLALRHMERSLASANKDQMTSAFLGLFVGLTLIDLRRAALGPVDLGQRRSIQTRVR